MKEARFYEKKKGNAVECQLCPHRCQIKPGHTGICHVRRNDNGTLYSLVYGAAIALHVDPIEKKPLFHFYPGSLTYSIATVGCNLRCKHCQNADISQASPSHYDTETTSSEIIVQQAIQTRCTSIAYTYTEPTVFYEYAFDTAKLAHEKGIKNVFVTNGYISKEPLEAIASYIDAANIDLKSMNETFYKQICGAHLSPVLESIQRYYDLGIWIELTTLLIPGYNDSNEELHNIATFISNIDPSIPWHVTAFHPTYELTDAPPTQTSTLEKAARIGKEHGLSFIYQGNVGSGEDTICPTCGKTLIARSMFHIGKNIIKDATCPYCGTDIKGTWF
jgi:pyruvate formate lyase activating enzyme